MKRFESIENSEMQALVECYPNDIDLGREARIAQPQSPLVRKYTNDMELGKEIRRTKWNY